MTAFLTVELEPGAEPGLAANALRRPALRVHALEFLWGGLLATVEVEDAEALAEALAAVCGCRSVRAGDAVAFRA